MSGIAPRALQPALDRHHYTDPSSFVREAEMLRREWTCIGRLDDLGLAASGRLLCHRRVVTVFLGESVIVAADGAGSLHAFANVCRHRGSQVVPVEPGCLPEPCDAKSLRCPYHSWTYGLDGRLLHAPHTEDVDLDTSDFSACAPRPGEDSSGSPTIWTRLL